MGKGDQTGKQIVTQQVSNADNTLQNGPSNQAQSILLGQVQKSNDELNQINAGNFAGVPLVQAVNQAANLMRNYTPKPSGSAALAANENGAGGGYADQEEAYRKRLLQDEVGNATVGAVQAERNYDTSVLFPGTSAIDQFDLQKAATYGQLAGQGNQLYNTSQQYGFWSNLGRSFGSSLGRIGGDAGGAGAWG